MIGYIGRINQTEKEAMEDWDEDRQANYRGTEYIGKLGLEQSYEARPARHHRRRGGRDLGRRPRGAPARQQPGATPGNTLMLSIDIKLQKLIEEMFGDRRGALVAIDPSNGEVLAFVSKPTFDPNLFVDGIDADNWQELNESIDKPLLNRALRGTYPPGSTYKPFMALAALETGKRTPQQTIFDPGYFMFGNHRFRDDKEGGHGTRGHVQVDRAVLRHLLLHAGQRPRRGRDGTSIMEPFGFGQLTGIDIEGEVRGLLPSTGLEAQRAYRKPEQQTLVCGRDHLAGHRPGLQQLHHAADGAGDGHAGQRRRAHEAAPGERGGRRGDGQPTRRSSRSRPSRYHAKPENIAVMRKRAGRREQRGHSARVFRGAPYACRPARPARRRWSAIKENEKYNAAQDRRATCATMRCSSRMRRPTTPNDRAGDGGRERRLRRAAAAPIARRVFDYWLLGP